jgi:para-nitrobenzyl esterase
VMIYGQSGGGSKVTTLMGMPSAAGLIHRAAAQSGGGNIPSRDQQKELSRQVMKELGLAVNDIRSLQRMDWAKLFAAGQCGGCQDQSAGAADDGTWGAFAAKHIFQSTCFPELGLSIRWFSPA